MKLNGKMKLHIDNLTFSKIYLFFFHLSFLFERKNKHATNWYKTCTIIYRNIKMMTELNCLSCNNKEFVFYQF